MAIRLAAVLLALIFCACGGGGSDSGGSPVPLAQWGRVRSDISNSGVGVTSLTNTAVGTTAAQLDGGPIRTTPTISINGTVMVATEFGGIVALDSNLVEQWRYTEIVDGSQTHPVGCARSCALSLDGFGNTLFGTDDGYVVSINDIGLPNWDAPAKLGSAVTGSAILVIDPVFLEVQALFVTTEDGRVVALGGQDGQIRWQFPTAGPIKASLGFDGVTTLYAPSADGFLYTLTQRGTNAFPPAPLGETLEEFSASPSLFGQIVVQSGLASNDGGKVSAFSTAGVLPIWQRTAPLAAVKTSVTQFTRALTSRLELSDGSISQGTVNVTDYLAVDDDGNGWLLDPQIGTLGTRCIGGLDDLQACRDDRDCNFAVLTPSATPTGPPGPTPTPTVRPCQPMTACSGGDNDGVACRTDIASTNCPGGSCVPITTCVGGSAAGMPCLNDDACLPGGVCNFAIFNVSGTIDASPVSTTEGSVLVAASSQNGGSVLYAIEPPNTRQPVESMCAQPAPAFCRFAFAAGGVIRSSPSVANSGTIYVADDLGFVYALTPTVNP